MKPLNPASIALSLALKTLQQPLELFGRYQALTHNTSANGIRLLKECGYGDHRLQTIDLFLPAKQDHPQHNTRYPILVFIHGGLWVAGDKVAYSGICQRLCEIGFIVANLNYRLAPGVHYVEQIQDINQGILWVTQTLHSLHGNTQHLYLMGDNAGANLALNYALALQHPYLRNALGMQRLPQAHAIKGLLLLHGIYDLTAGILSYLPLLRLWHQAILGKHAHGAPDHWVELASPLQHLHRRLPPVFIGDTEADPFFSQSTSLAKALKTFEHPYATAFYDKAQHPIEHHWMFHLQMRPGAKKMLEEAIQFLQWQTQQHAEFQTTHTDFSTPKKIKET